MRIENNGAEGTENGELRIENAHSSSEITAAAEAEDVSANVAVTATEVAPASSAVTAEVDEAAASAAAAKTEEIAASSAAKAVNKEDNSNAALPKSVMTGAMVVGLLLGIAVFIVVPAVLTNLIIGDYTEKTILWNVIDGLLRVAIFLGYLFLIGRMPDVKRMFGYHGAEHRTIHCYERGKDLTVANAQMFPSLHVRCGTAFMLMTMVIAIFVFTIVPVQLLIGVMGIQNEVLRLIVVIFSRIILLPFIAGLSYELTVRWAGSHPDNPVVKVILWPGLQLQRLTTNPPDDGMVECAIAAMNAVLAREQAEAEKTPSARKLLDAEKVGSAKGQQEDERVAAAQGLVVDESLALAQGLTVAESPALAQRQAEAESPALAQGQQEAEKAGQTQTLISVEAQAIPS